VTTVAVGDTLSSWALKCIVFPVLSKYLVSKLHTSALSLIYDSNHTPLINEISIVSALTTACPECEKPSVLEIEA